MHRREKARWSLGYRTLGSFVLLGDYILGRGIGKGALQRCVNLEAQRPWTGLLLLWKVQAWGRTAHLDLPS